MPRHKNCAVPNCTVSSKKNPEKVFFMVPKVPSKRKKWFQAIKRTYSGVLSTMFFVCEDHFDLEKDLQNFVHFKYGKPKYALLKEDVVPHIFEPSKPRKERIESIVRARKKLVEDIIEEYDRRSMSEPSSSEPSHVPACAENFKIDECYIYSRDDHSEDWMHHLCTVKMESEEENEEWLKSIDEQFIYIKKENNEEEDPLLVNHEEDIEKQRHEMPQIKEESLDREEVAVPGELHNKKVKRNKRKQDLSAVKNDVFFDENLRW